MATRTYKGVGAEDRRAARRVRLLEAGLEELGTRGYDATTVRRVCERAGLTERYFYESFDDRLGLLAAVYDLVVGEVMAAVATSVAGADDTIESRIRAGVTAFVDTLVDDPRRARVQLVEVVGRSEALESTRREVMRGFAAFIVETAVGQLALADVGSARTRIASLGLVGATNEVVVDWSSGTLTATRDEVVDTLVEMYLAIADLAAVDDTAR